MAILNCDLIYPQWWKPHRDVNVSVRICECWRHLFTPAQYYVCRYVTRRGLSGRPVPPHCSAGLKETGDLCMCVSGKGRLAQNCRTECVCAGGCRVLLDWQWEFSIVWWVIALLGHGRTDVNNPGWCVTQFFLHSHPPTFPVEEIGPCWPHRAAARLTSV